MTADFAGMGKRLREAREKELMSQNDLALESGVAPSTISYIECGHSTASVWVLADGKRGGPGGGAERSIDMDAVEFIRERNRMCKHFRGCGKCPADGMICGTISEMNDAEGIVQIVEEWSAAHPRKTRQSALLEQYPYAKCVDGISVLCPGWVDTSFSCPMDGNNNVDCNTCRHEFWMQEVE